MNSTDDVPLTVGDLTEEHVGWLVKVIKPFGDPLVMPHRTIILGRDIRRWIYDGRARVGLLDTSAKAPGIAGTEFQYDPTTPCVLVRQVVKPRRKRAS